MSYIFSNKKRQNYEDLAILRSKIPKKNRKDCHKYLQSLMIKYKKRLKIYIKTHQKINEELLLNFKKHY
jgi:hypothetical protein